jgi:hypothetical protein
MPFSSPIPPCLRGYAELNDDTLEHAFNPCRRSLTAPFAGGQPPGRELTVSDFNARVIHSGNISTYIYLTLSR